MTTQPWESPRVNLPWNRKPWIELFPQCPYGCGYDLRKTTDGFYVCRVCGRVTNGNKAPVIA